MVTSPPVQPPFTIRARVLTPLAAGGTRYERDGRLEVDERGRLASVGPFHPEPGDDARPPVDLRPLVLLPGLVDLHVHLPQLPNAGVGAGLHLLDWLERYIFPLERGFDEATSERLAPAACRAFAASGTTTAVMYGAVYEPSLDAAFRAVEAHGMRAVIGKVMMDRGSYDTRLPPDTILETSLRQSADLCTRWHGKDGGRLRYAFTPRFAITSSPDLLRESAALAAASGAYWQTHLSEDHDELDEVARLFPDAIDYLDVYDRAGALGPRTILAHSIHLSDREVGRIAETGTAIAHCPASNLFLSSGAMPLAHYLGHGIRVGLGSDVGAGPELSIFANMRAGAYTQSGLHVLADGRGPEPLDPLEWLRLATMGGARALGIDGEIGSLEADKEADMIAVDPRLVAPVDGIDSDDPAEIMSRLAFRPHADMVRLAWVRGRALDGPPGLAPA
ncbi:MAG TPA: amidohydrolase family protein [Candidatus Limnocylindrales bacterium]|nr:amidohydrolase family protein [Candidatus Limnocylindrales bacterium]